MMYIDYMGKTRYQEHPTDDMITGKGSNSWFISLPLSSCRNIFGEGTDYRVQAFSCKCNSEKIYVTSNDQKQIKDTCSNCENNYFIDVAQFTNNSQELLVNIDQEARYYIKDGYAYAELFINVPRGVDLIRDKMIYHLESIYQIKMALNGGETYYQKNYKISSEVQEVTYYQLLLYISKHYLQHTVNDYSEMMEKRQSYPQLYKAVRFFLEYPLIKYAELIHWHIDDNLYHDVEPGSSPQRYLEHLRNYRGEKSIKRALYKRYQEEISVGKFDALTPYIICRVFQNVDHIYRLLSNHDFVFTYHYHLDDTGMKNLVDSHIRLLQFLMERYTEQQLVNMFERTNGYTSLWEDTVRMFSNLFEIDMLSDFFIAPRANMLQIHNEFVRSRVLAKEHSKSVDFTYAKGQQRSCGLWRETYEVILPKNNEALIEWSKKLNNCLYGYTRGVYTNEITIYGVLVKKSLCYTIEIRNGQLVQMKGKHNINPDEKTKKALDTWYQHYFGTSSKEQTLLGEDSNE